jgi:mannose-6-phosphate isomerase-like protein (cupin superfamily)
MRAIWILLIIPLIAATAARAQQPASNQTAQETNIFASSADVAALIAKAKSERKDGQAIVSEHLLQLSPYNVNLEYRASVGPAAVHEREAELFYVIDGSGTMVTGGSLVNQTRSNATNLSGTAIEGGTSQKISKGDFLFVPENTPHWISAIDGTIVLMTVHVPRPLPRAN